MRVKQTGLLDNAIQEIGLAMVYDGVCHYAMRYKSHGRTGNIYVSKFSIFWDVIRQLFHSRLLNMR